MHVGLQFPTRSRVGLQCSKLPALRPTVHKPPGGGNSWVRPRSILGSFKVRSRFVQGSFKVRSRFVQGSKTPENKAKTRCLEREEKLSAQNSEMCTKDPNMSIQMIVTVERLPARRAEPGISRQRDEYARDAQHPQLPRHAAGRAKRRAQTISDKRLAATAPMRNSGKKTRRRCALRIFRPKLAVPAARKCNVENRDKPRQTATAAQEGGPGFKGEG